MRALGSNIHDGDVILTNHPAAGGKTNGKHQHRLSATVFNVGSHLPDLTVITPVCLPIEHFSSILQHSQ
jgi:N-methylhydantoinase B/oxoprolinase/acetone carboxylase alpha subunit